MIKAFASFLLVVLSLLAISCSAIQSGLNINKQPLDATLNNPIRGWTPIDINNNSATILVCVKANNDTKPNVTYRIQLIINNIRYDGSGMYRETQSQIDEVLKIGMSGDMIFVPIPLNVAQNLNREISNYTVSAHNQAVEALNKFHYDHDTQLLKGALVGSAGGLSYDEYQKLLQEQQRLEDNAKNPSTLDYDSILGKEIKILVITDTTTTP